MTKLDVFRRLNEGRKIETLVEAGVRADVAHWLMKLRPMSPTERSD